MDFSDTGGPVGMALYKRSYLRQECTRAIADGFTQQRGSAMNMSELVSALESVDSFHKRAFMLFDDLVALVREKVYRETLTDLTGHIEGYRVKDPGESEFVRLWVFEHHARVRFLAMLVKTSDRYLNEPSPRFKAMCQHLGRDPRFPMLLVYGVFEPPPPKERYPDIHPWLKHWVLNTMLIDTLEEQGFPDIQDFRFGDLLTLEGKEGIEAFSSWYCEGAKFVMRDLLTITDFQKLSEIADHLLSL